MKQVKAIIEGKEVLLNLTQEQEAQVFGDGMDEIYAFHKTTREEFDKKYEGIPDNLKALQQEFMIVDYYNKGWRPVLEDGDVYKYYPWFEFDENGCQVFSHVSSWCASASVPAPSLFIRESDCEEAVKKFDHIYQRSRGYCKE